MPADMLALALEAQYVARVYAPVRAAYESAKGSGRLDFIEDADLRLAIGTHYETGQGEERAVNDLVVSSLFEFTGALRPYVSFDTEFPPIARVPAVSLAVPWSEVQADRELRNTLVGSEGLRRLSVGRLRIYERAIRDLEARVSAELAPP